jgi:glycerol-3-phosphate dehydrogenase
VVSKRIAVVGAGVNGTSIATACAKRGFDVALFDAGAPFAETSSKSSRMLHGGIRYLEQGHIKLVREALIERDEWRRIAPNATRVERFFFPIYSDSPRGRATLFAGALLYQWLAGRFSLGKSHIHSRQDLLKNFPELKSNNLRGGVSYCDLVMDDQALAQILLSEAHSSGVTISPNTPISNLTTDGTLEVNGDEISFDHIINATGPWASDVLTQANIESRFDIEHVRGSHLLLELSLPHALVFQVPTDNRIVFCIPQSADEVLLGTTEHSHHLADPIECSEAEVDYLLAVLQDHLDISIGRDRIKTTLSGVRPIAKTRQAEVSNMSTASRDSEIEVVDSLINVFGGKWTSARHLGQKVAALI